MEKTGKIAVIGDKDGALAFKAIGAEVFSPNDEYEANETLKKLARGDYAVVFVFEPIAEKIGDIIKKLKSRPYPAVIPLPTAAGSNGFGMKGIKEDVEKAVGADILFNKD